jgi:hypothetical protein
MISGGRSFGIGEITGLTGVTARSIAEADPRGDARQHLHGRKSMFIA